MTVIWLGNMICESVGYGSDVINVTICFSVFCTLLKNKISLLEVDVQNFQCYFKASRKQYCLPLSVQSWFIP